jgi:NTE family protein
VEKGIDDNGKLKYIYIHNIRTPDEMLELGVSSKMNADWNFLKYLHELGKKHADRWIENNYDHIGKKTTCPVQDIYL